MVTAAPVVTVGSEPKPNQAPARRRNLYPYVWMLPALFFMLVAVIIPLIYTVYISCTNYNQTHLFDFHWVGLRNYAYALSTDPLTGYAHAYLWLFGWTFAFAALCTILNVCIGMAIALLVNNPRVPGRIVFRAFLILPWALPAMITAATWRGILNTNFGAVNSILKSLNLGQPAWLDDPNLAKLSLILINAWFSFPFFMVTILGILQSIPNDLFEAGQIDGANGIARFFHIIIPTIRSALAPLVVVQFGFQFNNAAFIYAITQGGPPSLDISGRGETDTLGSYLYNLVSSSEQFGQAAALGVLIFLVILVLSVVNVRLTGAFKEAN